MNRIIALTVLAAMLALDPSYAQPLRRSKPFRLMRPKTAKARRSNKASKTLGEAADETTSKSGKARSEAFPLPVELPFSNSISYSKSYSFGVQVKNSKAKSSKKANEGESRDDPFGLVRSKTSKALDKASKSRTVALFPLESYSMPEAIGVRSKSAKRYASTSAKSEGSVASVKSSKLDSRDDGRKGPVGRAGSKGSKAWRQ
ncbi:hypothetical protein ACHAWF_010078 [Thalassiosira exigua]